MRECHCAGASTTLSVEDKIAREGRHCCGGVHLKRERLGCGSSDRQGRDVFRKTCRPIAERMGVLVSPAVKNAKGRVCPVDVPHRGVPRRSKVCIRLQSSRRSRLQRGSGVPSTGKANPKEGGGQHIHARD